MEQQSNMKIAMHVSWVSIVMNALLSLFKMLAGVIAQSGAMISDAVHSASDVLSTVIVIIGVRIAGKAPDKEHQFGHERMECVAAIILAVILCATGLGIGASGLSKIFGGSFEALAIPGVIALAAALISIVVKEGMYWYTRAAAKKIHSGALMADAWHHRSDALSSVGSFVGILGARLGFPVMDPIASVVICVFIVKAAFDIFKDSIDKMTDRACDDETVAQIRDKINQQPGVLGIDRINTRLFGDKMYIEVEIAANGKATLEETHDIAEKVHDAVEEGFPSVKHCMVHVNPAKNIGST